MKDQKDFALQETISTGMAKTSIQLLLLIKFMVALNAIELI